MKLSDKEQQLAQRIGIGLAVVLFIIGFALQRTGVIPGPERVVAWLSGLYASYGYWVVFLSALLEGLIIINFYIPGSTSILLGVILADRSGLSVPVVVALVVAGFTISLTIDYFIGRHGIKKLLHSYGYGPEVAKQSESLARQSTWTILTSYFHPNIATFIATGAGIIGMPFRKFFIINLIALIIWDSLWGLGAYVLRDAALRLAESPYVMLLFPVWIAIAFYIPYWQSQRSAKATKQS